MVSVTYNRSPTRQYEILHKKFGPSMAPCYVVHFIRAGNLTHSLPLADIDDTLSLSGHLTFSRDAVRSRIRGEQNLQLHATDQDLVSAMDKRAALRNRFRIPLRSELAGSAGREWYSILCCHLFSLRMPLAEPC